MSNYFNDSPIEKAEDDRYGVEPFAQALARGIVNIKDPVGTTIALYGEWGSGKSSVVNLVRSSIDKENNSELIVTEFKGWWFRGEEALALAFLQNLSTVLKDGIGDQAKALILGLAKRVLQSGPSIGAIVGAATANPVAGVTITGASKVLSDLVGQDKTVESYFNELSELLAKQSRRFLVIVDDIDRLNPEEAMAIFRLIKSVGRLPNVMYLLAFDRELAEKAVAEKYPSEQAHFLEKIIQAGFDLPVPLKSDLNAGVLAEIGTICGFGVTESVQFMNVFYDVIAPHIRRPRDVVRFRNAISVTWPAIGTEVNAADFIALETLRIFEPILFRTIRQNKDKLCGVQQHGENSPNQSERIDPFLTGLAGWRLEVGKAALQRIFPRMGRVLYGNDVIARWDSERRVCVPKHFDTYFRLALSEETLPLTVIQELVEKAGDKAFVQKTFRQAAKTPRKGRGTLVPVYLDELTSYACHVEKKDVEVLLTALFEIHDEIDLDADADKGFYAMAQTTLRYHWLIRRVTEDRFSLEERTNLYLAATKSASLGWMVDFTRSTRREHEASAQVQRPEEDRLVTKEAARGPLTEHALQLIRSAAKDGSLLNHPDLISILYRWEDFLDGDASEARAWTDALIPKDEVLVTLAGRLTSTSWSAGMGMGGGFLADRVARGSPMAAIPEKMDFLDLDAFRAGLERVSKEGRIDPDSLKIVQTFLAAWDAKSQN
ncbi:MAG: P-loop NTPase fold protein [Pseudomonadota bacterium]